MAGSGPTAARTSASGSPRSRATFATRFRQLGPSLVGKALDNRLGVATLIELVKNPPATFFVRVKGNSMTGAGIFDGDTLVVDRSLEAASGSVVVAVVDGELTVKRLSIRRGKVRLLPENPEFPPIEFRDGQELVVWGVVTNVIHPVR